MVADLLHMVILFSYVCHLSHFLCVFFLNKLFFIQLIYRSTVTRVWIKKNHLTVVMQIILSMLRFMTLQVSSCWLFFFFFTVKMSAHRNVSLCVFSKSYFAQGSFCLSHYQYWPRTQLAHTDFTCTFRVHESVEKSASRNFVRTLTKLWCYVVKLAFGSRLEKNSFIKHDNVQLSTNSKWTVLI